jgi:heme-degrading monooxygenase HmoA
MGGTTWRTSQNSATGIRGDGIEIRRIKKLIARIWHGYAKPEQADAYEALLKPEVLPGISKAKGYKGAYLLRRDLGSEVEFMTILLWDSIDAIRAVAGDDYETAVVPEERRKYLSRYDAKAAHFEVASAQGIDWIG